MFYFSGQVLAPCPLPPPSPSGSGGMLPRKIVKFYTCRDVFSSILKLQRMWSNYQKNIKSNSLPTNEDICSSVISTWSVCYSACVKVLCFTTINKHGRSTEANVVSSTAFCGRIMLAPRKKKYGESGKKKKRKTDRDLHVVEVVEVDTTRKQQKIHFVGFNHEYDEWRDYNNKRNYFPFVLLEKMFFPEEGSLEDRGNIFHGQLYRCLIPSISSQLCVQEQILWSLLRPLKWYKLKSCGNK